MEQSVESKAEDVPVTAGDNDVCRMSVITVEFPSLTSVHSDNSSVDEVDDLDYMLDTDDGNEVVDDMAVSENSAADIQPPVLDIVQCSIVKEGASIEADAEVSSDNFCMAAVNGTEVADDNDECDSSFCENTATENAEENSIHAKDLPSEPVQGSSDKCDRGMEMASGDNSTIEPGIVYSDKSFSTFEPSWGILYKPLQTFVLIVDPYQN